MVNTAKMKGNLLRKWGLEESVTEIRNDQFRYSYDLGVIDFIFLTNEDEFYEIHNEIWCEDRTEFFLAVFKNGEIHVCDSKTIPDREQSLEKATIASFKYGESTPESQKYGRLFKRENIEAGECIKEMQKLLSQRMRKSIDEDLMENMESCKREVSTFMKDRGDREEIAEKIVDRCLFIRFLEDKSGNNNLINILKSEDGEKLLNLFDFYSNIFKIIFEKGDISNIKKEVVRELAHVFGDSPYSDFPSTRYLFSHIPVTVVTRMYERILSQKGRKNPLTRERVREFTIDTILDEPCISDRIKKGHKIRILDPSCQSGEVLAIFLRKIVEKKGIKELREKIQILQNCFYGMDTSTRALRVTAVNLYLNVIEGENPDIIKRAFFSDGEMFTLNVFSPEDSFCQKFDVIVCDLDTLEEKNIEKNSLQSSDFLLSIEEWMKRGASCGVIVPLSYFTTHESEKFRKDFMERYALKSFVNLSKMDTKNPACIVFFTNIPVDLAEFYTPEHSFFSEVTGFIGKDNKARVKGVALKEDDSIWPVYALGFHKYRRLVKFLDNTRCSSFEDFLNIDKSTICNDEAFLYENTKICKEEPSTMYRTSSTTRDFKNVKPSHVAGEDTEQVNNNYMELVEGDFKKRKLIVQKTWPIRAFIDSYVCDDSWGYTLKASCPEEWLLLFESILNSKLASLYLEIKYRLGKGSSHVEREHINKFPIPDLVDDYGIGSKIIETVRLLKSLPCTGSRYKKVENDLEDLIFALYDSNYYDLKETEQYIIEREKGDALVTEGVIRKYCEEFIYILHSFVKKGFFLKPEWATSESFGTMVRFTLSRTVIPLQYNKELERFVHITENQRIECEKKDVFKEKEIRFYDNNGLYIYRSNKLRDWTDFMAINDANKELVMYFQNLEDE